MPDSYPINLNDIKIFRTCLVFLVFGIKFLSKLIIWLKIR